jgi:hypothetical protein
MKSSLHPVTDQRPRHVASPHTPSLAPDGSMIRAANGALRAERSDAVHQLAASAVNVPRVKRKRCELPAITIIRGFCGFHGWFPSQPPEIADFLSRPPASLPKWCWGSGVPYGRAAAHHECAGGWPRCPAQIASSQPLRCLRANCEELGVLVSCIRWERASWRRAAGLPSVVKTESRPRNGARCIPPKVLIQPFVSSIRLRIT